ncbi:hypothetical protein BH09BAC4_BH09BAC4_09920 [soil metagenome]
MNSNNSSDYNPADDENQGIAQLLVRAEESNTGIPQADYMNPVTAQGPEPEKAEVNDHDDVPSDGTTNGVNDDMLEEEYVEDGDLSEEEE